MVNEVNKPPSSDNIVLGERLAASNRQLNEMQEEHRHLLQEMAVLRQRATELSNLSDQQSNDIVGAAATVVNATTDVTDVLNSSTTEMVVNSSTQVVDSSTIDKEIPTETESHITATAEVGSSVIPIVKHEEYKKDVEDDEDPEAAEYLRQKIAEIASLKAQFKRVQHIMNATDLIEQHIASKESDTTKEEEISTNATANKQKAASSTPTPDPAPETDPAIALTMNLLQSTDLEQTTHHVNEHDELLSAMMNMFSEFTSDLRSQADSLRAERDRLRALKEELIRRKRQS